MGNGRRKTEKRESQSCSHFFFHTPLNRYRNNSAFHHTNTVERTGWFLHEKRVTTIGKCMDLTRIEPNNNKKRGKRTEVDWLIVTSTKFRRYAFNTMCFFMPAFFFFFQFLYVFITRKVCRWKNEKRKKNWKRKNDKKWIEQQKKEQRQSTKKTINVN